MRHITLLVGLLLVTMPAVTANAADHVMVASPDAVNWSAAPPSFPKGAQVAVLSGDPSKAGPFVLRIKAPAGYKVPAHTHPADENVTVISGVFNVGMGDKLDQAKSQPVKAGGYAHMPQGMAHFAWFDEETVVQLNGIGPFGISYVNPADDPRKGQ
jgi:quercetin dioxygenase-like cupin family protein